MLRWFYRLRVNQAAQRVIATSRAIAELDEELPFEENDPEQFNCLAAERERLSYQRKKDLAYIGQHERKVKN